MNIKLKYTILKTIKKSLFFKTFFVLILSLILVSLTGCSPFELEKLSDFDIVNGKTLTGEFNYFDETYNEIPITQPEQIVCPVNNTNETKTCARTNAFNVYGRETGYHDKEKPHMGNDFDTLGGDEIIFSSTSGIVVETGNTEETLGPKLGLGKYVVVLSSIAKGFKAHKYKSIEFENINQNEPIILIYGHCDSISVKKGQIINASSPLCIIGDTGNAFGAHVHIELYKLKSFIEFRHSSNSLDVLGLLNLIPFFKTEIIREFDLSGFETYFPIKDKLFYPYKETTI